MTKDRNAQSSSRFAENVRNESDLAQDRMGKNSLQGDDQRNIQNQRHSVPDEKQESEGVIESFENMDAETRAQRDQERRKS